LVLDSAGPYLLLDGTLDECIREFMAKPGPVRHLYEIHTSPQPPLVGAIYYLERWLQENDPEGVAFQYKVME